MKNSVTIIIPSYRSKNLILSHIQNFYNKFKIIIVENSNDLKLKKIIKKLFPRVDIFLKKNIGYGRAVNFAATKVRTKFFFVMNPDLIIYRNTLNNLITVANRLKKFGAIGPVYENHKNKYKKKIVEVNKLVSASMLINKKIFLDLKGYDENFFLYYEDDDFFLKCSNNNLKMFLATKSLVKHKKTKTIKKTLNLQSTTFSNYKERNSTILVGGWHGQWSKFYFFKKNYGYIKAIRKCLPNNLINIIQIFLFFF